MATAKPPPDERRKVPHHLIDVADPRIDFSLADYADLAGRAIERIAARGRVPVVTGGTGLYLRGLLRGVVPAPRRSEALRGRLRGMAERYGSPRLHRWLRRLDPGSAARLPPRDFQRIVRALEIAIEGGRSWSERLLAEGTWASGAERFDALKIGLDVEARALAGRLDARVDRFFRDGLANEVRRLLEEGVPVTANAFKAIGYREVLRAVLSGADPESAREEVRRNTRRYAKRQRTWFRKEPGIVWLDASGDEGALAAEAVRLFRAGGRSRA